MYPFFILKVSPDDPQEKIDAQYQSLISANPPDRNPEYFKLIREAYLLIKDPRDRIRESLFYRSKESPQSFINRLKLTLNQSDRSRLSLQDLRSFIESQHDDG